ncbi:tyrosine-type recombinase/integrase [candidate division WOR-3 bacterium]|nr:tyrosine-type recombinase/integrase [candidate division WOR-3 bacterium]
MNVYQRGKCWYVDFSYRGKRFRRSAGRTKREALLKLGEIRKRIEQEDQDGTSASAPRSFAEYANEYLEYSKTHKRPSSYQRDTVSIKRLMEAFAECKLSDIKTADIERYQERRLETVGHATINREVQALKHMFRKAQERGYVKINPAQPVKKLEEPFGRTRYLQLEERERLLDECSGMLHAIVFTALETGMRKGELENLTWKNVYFERRSIWLERTKNKEPRTIPISDNLLPVLQRLYIERRSEYVFTKPGGEPYGSWRKAFDNACKRAGIEDFRFHDLRHTFASYLVVSDVKIRTVQELMGHKDIKMTMRYSHLSKEHLLDAVNKVGTNLAQLKDSTVEVSHKLRNYVCPRSSEG